MYFERVLIMGRINMARMGGQLQDKKANSQK